MKHRTSTALTIVVAFLLIVAFSGRVQAQTYIEYKVQLNSDGSAAWTITQVTGINATVDTWAGFQERIITLTNAAASHTGRQMSVDNSSFQMSTFVTSSNSKTTEYTFTWLNFSKTEQRELVAGDVFGVPGFFDQMYGDGELQINYPANYTLVSVSPTPEQEDGSTQTLIWLGTQFFVTENPSIVLSAQKSAVAGSEQLSSYLLVSAVASVAVVAFVAGWFFISRRQKMKETPVVATVALPETEEEKVLRVLRSSGGSAYQSAITEQCRFSKAKASQLLTALETKGLVRRYKKGRDKIVNIVEQSKAKNNAG